MSDWNGPAKRGAMRLHREELRTEAEERDAALPEDSPLRRRNKGKIIVAPPITLHATGDVAG